MAQNERVLLIDHKDCTQINSKKMDDKRTDNLIERVVNKPSLIERDKTSKRKSVSHLSFKLHLIQIDPLILKPIRSANSVSTTRSKTRTVGKSTSDGNKPLPIIDTS
jgi:hypothetical protein